MNTNTTTEHARVHVPLKRNRLPRYTLISIMKGQVPEMIWVFFDGPVLARELVRQPALN